LDIHKKLIVAYAIVPGSDGQPRKHVRSFGSMSDDLEKLSGRLAEQGVTHVAMDSTASYWKPVVRHEALFDREGMKGPLLRAVAAGR
jgi:transposase